MNNTRKRIRDNDEYEDIIESKYLKPTIDNKKRNRDNFENAESDLIEQMNAMDIQSNKKTIRISWLR